MTAHFAALSLAAESAESLATGLALHFTTPGSLLIACGNQREVRHLASLDLAHLPLVAFSSCLTSASSCDAGSADAHRLQIFVIDDPTGAYGKASAPLQRSNIAAQICQLLQQATQAAGRAGEQPALIWCLQPPGFEEQILAAIAAVTGPHVPVIGGSSADDDIAGQWCQFDGTACAADLLVLLVLYPSCPLSYFFSSGYHQLNLQAVVTQASQRRLYQLDHQNAALVYNSWLNKVGQPTCLPGNILQQSALVPFGRQIAAQPVPLYLLTHPAELHADGSISLMSDVKTGDQLYLMMGSEDALVRRAGHVVKVAADSLQLRYHTTPAGAIVFYCAGCMLTIRARYHEVQQHVRAALGDIPFLIAYTFDEQGCFADGSNRHGNLMISVLLFGNPALEATDSGNVDD